MPRSKCSGHSTAAPGLSPGILAAKLAQRLPAEAVPLRQQAGGVRFDHQPPVQVEWGRWLVHPGRGARRDTANSAAARTVVRAVRLVPAAPPTTSSVPSTARNLPSVPNDGVGSRLVPEPGRSCRSQRTGRRRVRAPRRGATQSESPPGGRGRRQRGQSYLSCLFRPAGRACVTGHLPDSREHASAATGLGNDPGRPVWRGGRLRRCLPWRGVFSSG